MKSINKVIYDNKKEQKRKYERGKKASKKLNRMKRHSDYQIAHAPVVTYDMFLPTNALSEKEYDDMAYYFLKSHYG